VADTIKVSADVVQWIEQKINNKNDAGRYVKLFLSAMQTFNLSDVLYEVRNSVNPRIAALESKKSVIPQELPESPGAINVKTGELVEILDDENSSLAIVLKDMSGVNQDTIFTNEDIYQINQPPSVHISGNQTILDTKAFSGIILVPDQAASDSSSKAANTKFVTTAIGNIVTNQQYWLPAVAHSGLIYDSGAAISGAIGEYSSGHTYIVHSVAEGDDWQLVGGADPASDWVLFNDRDTYLSSSTSFAKVNGNDVKGSTTDILVQPQIVSGITGYLMTPPLTTGGQPGVISISGIVAWGDYIS
jgi:hypothetical protein